MEGGSGDMGGFVCSETANSDQQKCFLSLISLPFLFIDLHLYSSRVIQTTTRFDCFLIII
jgi:hypothetical protein